MSTNGQQADEGTLVTAEDGSLPERFTDPGHTHKLRMSDTDPEAARRAERQVAALFVVSIIGTIGFVVAYFLVPPGETVASIRLSNLMLGLGMALGLLGIGTAA